MAQSSSIDDKDKDDLRDLPKLSKVDASGNDTCGKANTVTNGLHEGHRLHLALCLLGQSGMPLGK